ncbi:acyltransferase [Trinickia violacea]|uniref:Acyltransferase n=1 Tax=Trinickia violacea TaxID=2571746 RepID=A0A4P8IWU1_9BURK|nr:acyltransferase [Trinickia violacea]QCP53828.1 acyltransferase [Trinickia violacea]
MKTNASLEGLRGAAALLVVVFHMSLSVPYLNAARNGYLAVDLFFVLSGFVISSAYGARLTDVAQFRTFMVRRFGRLWPTHVATTLLYYLCVNVGQLKASLAGQTVPYFVPSVKELVATASMAQGLNLFDHFVGTKVNWSAGDEFYVYVLFGALCLLLRGKSRLAAVIALALIGYVIAAWQTLGPNACLTYGHCLDLTYSYGWARCLVGFFTGALIAEYRDCAPLRVLRGRATQVFTFSAVLVFVFIDRMPSIALAAPIVFAALIASLVDDSGPIARLFQTSAAQYLGRISYSLYLGHAVFWVMLRARADLTDNNAIKLATGAVFLLMSFALAHLLNRLVEMPFRQRFNAWSDTAFRLPAPGNRGLYE